MIDRWGSVVNHDDSSSYVNRFIHDLMHCIKVDYCSKLSQS